ncbi:MAG: DUF1853 family protein [Marinobacter sp.]|nr:DUF1853 family protein [Marinobacter sp.]
MISSPPPLWRTPAVRHLAWLCQAPPLINTGRVLDVRTVMPSDYLETLQALDQSPEPLLARLADGNSHRLGLYFENLYHFLLTDVLNWTILLRNLPIRNAQGQTLGELDFVVRNPTTKRLEHHEVAVKFYLAFDTGYTTQWYGPNARDRLDLKADRMLAHQSRMTERPETRAVLADHHLDEPIEQAIVMPGYLFQSDHQKPPSVPDWVHPDHQRGCWIRSGQINQQDIDTWVPLYKPDWLGAYQSRARPDRTVTDEALAEAGERGWPRLFAQMKARDDGTGFEEYHRWFVMPESWPGLP